MPREHINVWPSEPDPNAKNKVSLISVDNVMHIDGVPMTFDAGLPSNVWAIQWDTVTKKGHIEYNDGTVNEEITSFPEYDGYKEKYDKAIADEAAAIQAKEDAKTYKVKRKEQYDLLNQFEMIYDDKTNTTDNWDKAIEAIKKTYPKPE